MKVAALIGENTELREGTTLPALEPDLPHPPRHSKGWTVANGSVKRGGDTAYRVTAGMWTYDMLVDPFGNVRISDQPYPARRRRRGH